MKNKLCYSFVVLSSLFLMGCSNVGYVQQMKGNLTIPEDEFKYKIAFVSINQPNPYSMFLDEENSQRVIRFYLIQKGYDVGVNPVSLVTHKALTPNDSLLVECSYATMQNVFQRNGVMGQSLTCGAFDLYDGKKVYEGEADLKANMTTDFDGMTYEGMRLSLMNLPKGNLAIGKILSQSDVYSKITHSTRLIRIKP